MRHYVSQKGSKATQEVAEHKTLIDTIEARLKPTSKTIKNLPQSDRTEHSPKGNDRVGNLVQDPVSKTWMTEEQKQSGNW
jgi:hypothetical protein